MKYTNQTNLPLPIAIWLAREEYSLDDRPNLISATTLLKPIKEIVLGIKYKSQDGTIDLSKLIKSRMGTAIHTAIEAAWTSKELPELLNHLYPKWIAERILINPKPEDILEDSIPIYMELRKEKEINGWIITGKFDFIENGKLKDFKSTSTRSFTDEETGKKYLQQGSIYRWLNPDIITDNKMSINFIFTDWNIREAKMSTDYPQGIVVEKNYQLMSIKDTEEFIKKILNDIDRYLQLPESALPDCKDNELWRKDTVWKYYRDPNKMARSTKNFSNQEEAYSYIAQQKPGGVLIEMKGEVVKCRYCSVLGLCEQAKEYIKNGELIIDTL